MENHLIVHLKASPLMPIPSDIGDHVEFSRSSSKPTISFSKKTQPRSSESRLNYLCRNGYLSEAVGVLDSIAKQGSSIRPITYINLLQSCIDMNCVQLGRELHSRIGLVNNVVPFVGTKLVSMYAKCGCLDDARQVFDEMCERNLFTWSAMIGACFREKRWREVVDLFFEMMEEGIVPDDFLLTKILRACGSCGDIEVGKLINSIVIRCGMCWSVRVNNSILSLYTSCGEMKTAEKVFNDMNERDWVSWNYMIAGYCQKGEIHQARKYFDAMYEEGLDPGLITLNILIAGYNQLGHCDVAMDLMRKMETLGIKPDVFTWTSMISGFAQNNRMVEALDLLVEMLLAGVEPSVITITSAVSACSTLKSLQMGMEIHSLAVKVAFVKDVLVGNSLIGMYSKCGDLEDARQVFDLMSERDLYTWNSLIGGYCQAGYCGKAHELFMKMHESDISPNIITWNVMISGHIQNGDEDQAMYLFQKIEKEGKIKRNTESWNTIISGYMQIGLKEKALGIFRQMQSLNVSLNPITILSVLPSCANLVAWKHVREIHASALRRHLASKRAVANSLVDAYAKSGNIVYARTIFDGMSSRDIITWNSLISGYVLHGSSELAICLFDQMKNSGLKPSRGTFASIISAYSLVGKVEKGKHAFSSITEDHHIRPGPEHYSAVVNLFGRSGRLREALEFIENMPIEPDPSIWTALLTACRIHGNLRLAIHAGERLLEWEPGNASIHHMMSRIYVLCGKLGDASKVRKLEKQNVTRPLGQCWMELNNEVHTFVSGEQSKSCSDRLYSWIHKVAMNDKRPTPQPGFHMEEEDLESVSGVHSEKLAIAFAFINSRSTPQNIRIVKNIRMCSDCHKMAKYMSVTYGCEIYLRDSDCFHHFSKGHCSCEDYW